MQREKMVPSGAACAGRILYAVPNRRDAKLLQVLVAASGFQNSP
jgi:hypothetical protein